jgi:hypothetical protein
MKSAAFPGAAGDWRSWRDIQKTWNFSELHKKTATAPPNTKMPSNK